LMSSILSMGPGRGGRSDTEPRRREGPFCDDPGHLLDGHSRPEPDLQNTIGGLQIKEGDSPVAPFDIGAPVCHDEAGEASQTSFRAGKMGNDPFPETHCAFSVFS
jgi:hypothetical protein